MKVKNQPEWDTWVSSNTDPYGKCCVDYALAWADAMESWVEAINDERRFKGEPEILWPEFIKDNAERISHEVDRRPGFGITGFMYGAAVHMLAECWEHGEDLRRWHNGEYGQPDAEGTINPAIITIEVPE